MSFSRSPSPCVIQTGILLCVILERSEESRSSCHPVRSQPAARARFTIPYPPFVSCRAPLPLAACVTTRNVPTRDASQLKTGDNVKSPSRVAIMDAVKATAIVIIVTLVAVLAGTTASAQSAPATPTAGGTSLPGNVPDGWKAEGWSQSAWVALYEQCLNIPAETTRRAHMTPEQLRGLKPIPGDWEACRHIFSAVGRRPAAARPQATDLKTTPTPVGT